MWEHNTNNYSKSWCRDIAYGDPEPEATYAYSFGGQESKCATFLDLYSIDICLWSQQVITNIYIAKV